MTPAIRSAEAMEYWGNPDRDSVVATATMATADVLNGWLPGSTPQPWTWDDEERDIYSRLCMCCDLPGHYTYQLEERVRLHGIDFAAEFAPPVLSPDGFVWDGHHRLVIARRWGIESIRVDRV